MNDSSSVTPPPIYDADADVKNLNFDPMAQEEVEPDDEESMDFDPEPDLIALEKELEQYKDHYLRTVAEFQNFRRRQQQEKDDLRKYASENLVRDLLPVIDNFQRTIVAAHSGATLESLVEGVTMVERQLRTALESVGLKRIPTVGSPFDPNLHEALGTDEANEQHPEGSITMEIEPGYQMADRVLRPARVKVAR